MRRVLLRAPEGAGRRQPGIRSPPSRGRLTHAVTPLDSTESAGLGASFTKRTRAARSRASPRKRRRRGDVTSSSLEETREARKLPRCDHASCRVAEVDCRRRPSEHSRAGSTRPSRDECSRPQTRGLSPKRETASGETSSWGESRWQNREIAPTQARWDRASVRRARARSMEVASDRRNRALSRARGDSDLGRSPVSSSIRESDRAARGCGDGSVRGG